MATPKGMKNFNRKLANGEKVCIYSDQSHIILQLRRDIPTEGNILEPSFKVAVELSPADALLIASELLAVAVPQVTEAQRIAAQLTVLRQAENTPDEAPSNTEGERV